MAFTDPLSLNTTSTSYSGPTLTGGTAVNFNLVKRDELMAEYRTADGLMTLTIQHTETSKSRTRTLVRLDVKKVSTNPLTPSTNEYVSDSVQVIIDRPAYGFSDVDLGGQVAALAAFLSQTNVTKLFGLQS